MLYVRLASILVFALPACHRGVSEATATDVPPPQRSTEATPHAKQVTQRVKPVRTFDVELASLDRERASWVKLSERTGGNRLHHERIASLSMRRARLTGSYDDYTRAEAALTDAMELAPSGTTHLLAAKLHAALHRLPQARDALALARKTTRPTPSAMATLEAVEANLAMHAGDETTARQHFEASLAAKRTSFNLSSFAVFQWKCGEFEHAETLFREALRHTHGNAMEPRAWIHLNLGLLDLDRGRHDDALAHYLDADRLLPGYWLIEEHIAEIETLRGRVTEAKARYLAIIDRTNNPEFMDAMAQIAFDAGDDVEGGRWVARARKRYEQQLQHHPEAAYGHALGHVLDFSEDPEFARTLARSNYALRPGLDASILLARAHLGAGDPRAAKRALRPMLSSSFESAELYATAAATYRALGNRKEGQRMLARARAIDPTIDE